MDILGTALSIASLKQERAGRGTGCLLSGAGGDSTSLAIAADGGESDLHRWLVASDLIMGQDRPILLPRWTVLRLSYNLLSPNDHEDSSQLIHTRGTRLRTLCHSEENKFSGKVMLT